MKLALRSLGTGLAIVLALSSLTFPLTEVAASPAKVAGKKVAVRSVSFTPPPIPPSIGSPGKRRGGGASRGMCPGIKQPLTALVPVTAKPNASPAPAQNYVWGYTLAERPTFWFYMPYTRAMEASAEFVLQDKAKHSLPPISVPLPEQAGIIAVRLPETVRLTADEPYAWFLTVFYCNLQKTAPPVTVRGTIYRKLEPKLPAPMADQAWAEQTNFYATQGIWYDALTTLGDRRRQNPQDPDLKGWWEKLLQDADLGDLAQEPIVP